MPGEFKEIAFVFAKKNRPVSDGEDIVNPCLHKITKWIGDESVEIKINEIALSKQAHAFTRHLGSFLIMYLSNRRIVSTHAPAFY